MRRHLQRSYLDHIKSELTPKETPATGRPMLPDGDELRPLLASNKGTDFRAVARAALRDLLGRIDAALARTQDPMTRVHLQDCRREIEVILSPKS